jgi:hypothetical protein
MSERQTGKTRRGRLFVILFVAFAMLGPAALAGTHDDGNDNGKANPNANANANKPGAAAPVGTVELEFIGEVVGASLPTGADVSGEMPDHNFPIGGRADLDALKKASKAAVVPKVGELNVVKGLIIPADEDAVGAFDPLAPPTLQGKRIDAIDSNNCGGCRPPDTHGAVGNTHFLQVTNMHVDAWKKGSKTNQMSVTLKNFFGGAVNTLFDPRALWDPYWNRFVVIATDHSTGPTDAGALYIAVSVTQNPLGSWHLYTVGSTSGVDSWFDYPQLGMSQDALIFTANMFTDADSFITTTTFAFPKATMYRGAGGTSSVFSNPDWPTLAPPVVLDTDGQAYLVQSRFWEDAIRLYEFRYPANFGDQALVVHANIAVAAFGPPPNAPQPGTANTLDTMDSRFQNNSTQIGNSLWNTHVTDDFGFAVPRYYEINTSNDTITQTGQFWASASSYDFNPAIAANTLNEVFVTWSSTDPTTNAQVRVSGRQPADPAGANLGPGILVKGSPTFYNPSGATNERWGDYAAVTLEPNTSAVPFCPAGRRAWATNEWIQSAAVWDSYINRIGFC